MGNVTAKRSEGRDMAFTDDWAKAIRSRAAELGLNQADIGRILGMSKQTGHRIWKGEVRPDEHQCDELEAALMFDSGELRVLAGYLPAGDNPKVERANGQIIVRLESRAPVLILGLVALAAVDPAWNELLYITWREGDTPQEIPDPSRQLQTAA